MVSQPLLIDQHTGSVTYIETVHDDSFFIFKLADAKLEQMKLDFNIEQIKNFLWNMMSCAKIFLN